MTGAKQETQLVLRAQCGDREALESLLRGVQSPLTRYIAGLVGPDAAEDVLQDVFLQICRKLEWLREAELTSGSGKANVSWVRCAIVTAGTRKTVLIPANGERSFFGPIRP